MSKKNIIRILACTLFIISAACSPTEDEINSISTSLAEELFSEQTATALAASPTFTLSPSPTITSTQTATLTPTPTPTPTSTATATKQPASDQSGSSSGDCSDSTQGRHRMRVENLTGETLTISFVGPENKICFIPTGISFIHLKIGYYAITYNTRCGTSFEEGPVSATWYFHLKC